MHYNFHALACMISTMLYIITFSMYKINFKIMYDLTNKDVKYNFLNLCKPNYRIGTKDMS